MWKVSHIPEHNVLFLHTLIVFVITELATGSEHPRDILVWLGTADRDIVVGKSIAFSIVLERGIAIAGEDPDAMSCLLVTHKPGSMGAQVFDVVPFIRIFFPSGTPAFIRASVIVQEDLIHPVAVDVKIESPIWIMHVVGIARKPTALDNRPYFAVVG